MPAWAAAGLVVGALMAMAAVAVIGIAFAMARASTRVERVPVQGHPQDLDLPHEDVVFESGDGTELRGWYVSFAADRQNVILVQGEEHHRNAPGIRALELARDLTGRGFSVLMFDLRARGESGGRRASAGNLELLDVEAAISFVNQRGVPFERIALFGFSLGAGLAILAAARQPRLGAIVCDSPFKDLLDDYREVRAAGVPIPSWLLIPAVRLVGRLIYRSDPGELRPILAASHVKTPALVIHGERDDVLPPSDAEALYDACASPMKELWIVPGASHVNSFTQAGTGYTDTVAAFLNRAMDSAPHGSGRGR